MPIAVCAVTSHTHTLSLSLPLSLSSPLPPGSQINLELARRPSAYVIKPNKHQFSYSFVCLMCQKSVVRNVSPSVTPLVTSIVSFDSQYSTFHHQNPHLSCAYYAISHFLTGHFYSFLYSCNGIFFNLYILMRLSAMQHPQPEDVYPEFPPQPQSFHPYSHNRR